MPARIRRYSTTLPPGPASRRRGLGYTASVIFHVALLVVLVVQTSHRAWQVAAARQNEATARPVQLVFAPPRPQPTPRPSAPEVTPPAVPITPGPDQTPGTTARVTPTPEQDPNANPDTPRTEATRPDPGETEAAPRAPSPAPPPTIAAPTTTAAAPTPTIESEARRIFGSPSSKLGPLAGVRDNRPWETPVELNSRGCTLPPPEPGDTTLPPGMGVVSGKIYNEHTGQPLPGARLQILGTAYGTFTNQNGEYRLYFDRTLVDRCRSQAVRVTAPGYQGRDVILYLGDRPSSDVPLTRN
jgi:hypothetical protein